MYKWFKLSEFDSPDRPGSGTLMEHEVVQASTSPATSMAFRSSPPGFAPSGQQEPDRTGYPASPNSSHLLGWAVDIAVPNSQRRFLLLEALLDAGFHRIGLGQNFIHCDLDPNKSQHALDILRKARTVHQVDLNFASLRTASTFSLSVTYTLTLSV